MISGSTTHKLDKIRTYSQTEPYKIGVNGVTNIDYDSNNKPIKVYYGIDGISYESNLTEISRLLENNRSLVNINRGTKINPQTTFKTNLPSYSNFLDNNGAFFRDEAKIGLVFPIKTEDQIFIERQYGTVLEQHSRLSEIKTLEGLINYRNGYYNIKNDF